MLCCVWQRPERKHSIQLRERERESIINKMTGKKNRRRQLVNRKGEITIGISINAKSSSAKECSSGPNPIKITKIFSVILQ